MGKMTGRKLLIISVLLNTCLLAALVQLGFDQPPVEGDAHNAETSAPDPAEDRPRPVRTDTPWSSVASSDLRVYMAKLRSVGCPEETIEDIIIAEVNHRFAG